MTDLSSKFRVMACDLPGHGDSDAAPEYTMESMAAAVLNQVNHFKLGQCLWVGHSMGCRIVLDAYRQNASQVAGMALIEGGCIAYSPAQSGELLKRVQAAGAKNILRRLFEDMFLQESDAPHRAHCLHRLELLDDNIAQQLLLSAADWDGHHSAGVLASIKVPLLLLQSTTVDAAMNRAPVEAEKSCAWIQYVKRQAPNTEVKIVEKAGHFAQFDQSAFVSAALESFAIEVLE